MLVTRVICPHCARRLRTTKPLPVGKVVPCPKCGASFAVRPEHPAPPSPSKPAVPVPAPVPPRQRLRGKTPPAPVETAAPVLPPRATGAGAGPRPARHRVLIGAVFAALLLLMALTAGLTLYFATKQDRNVPVATARPAVEEPSPVAEVPEEPAPAPDPDRQDPPPAPRREPPAPPPAPRREAPPPTPPSPERPAPAPRPWLSDAKQAQVKESIDKGVAFLKKSQEPSGTWVGQYPTGMAALPGLTLLECGVPADAPEIQKAAKFVRTQVPQLNKTYELALAILFLDRLDDPQDRQAIRTLALRLVAGQSRSGGWTYHCKVLEPRQERDLLLALQKRRPASPLELFMMAPVGKSLTDQAGGITKPALDVNPVDGPNSPARGADDTEPVPRAVASLPSELRKVPALQPPSRSHAMPRHDDFRTDNSNTQFAVLGLWAARRHNLPLERALALVVQRFRVSQTQGGGWGYNYEMIADRPSTRPPTPSMTGAGLLGLAVGLGLTADNLSAAARAELAHDPAIQKGLKVLSESIGKPLVKHGPEYGSEKQAINLYLLWTAERIGVLYNLQTIQDKEWYPWGAVQILANQEGDGSWYCRGYAGATSVTDTCFALLFLKRANLSRDLSKKLELFTVGKKLSDK